jgi:hypothetical protein
MDGWKGGWVGKTVSLHNNEPFTSCSHYFLLLLKWNPQVSISLDVVLPCVSQTNDSAVMYTVNSCIKIQVLFKITTLWTTREFCDTDVLRSLKINLTCMHSQVDFQVPVVAETLPALGADAGFLSRVRSKIESFFIQSAFKTWKLTLR